MYNSNMTNVIIEGPERAIEAGTWAEKNIKSGWDLDISVSPFSNLYNFQFRDPKEAVLFSLKWK